MLSHFDNWSASENESELFISVANLKKGLSYGFGTDSLQSRLVFRKVFVFEVLRKKT